MEGNSCVKRTLEPNCDVDEYCGSKAKRSKSDSCPTQDIITQMNQMFQQFVLSSKSVPLYVFQPLRPHLHIISRNRNPILNFLLSLTWSNSQSEEYLATLAALVYDLVVMKPQLIRELFNNIFLQYLKGNSASRFETEQGWISDQKIFKPVSFLTDLKKKTFLPSIKTGSLLFLYFDLRNQTVNMLVFTPFIYDVWIGFYIF